MPLIRFIFSYITSDAKLLAAARYALSQLTGNSNFINPSPDLATFQTKINIFSGLVDDAKTGDRMKILLKNEAKEELVETIYLMSAYVAFASQGSISVAQSSGLKLAKLPQPAAPIGIPQNIQASNTGQTGSIKSCVDAVLGAVSYMHQYTTDPELKEESWQTVSCSQRKCTITGLTPGTVHYFRVAAVGRKEQVMYSDVVNRVVA